MTANLPAAPGVPCRNETDTIASYKAQADAALGWCSPCNVVIAIANVSCPGLAAGGGEYTPAVLQQYCDTPSCTAALYDVLSLCTEGDEADIGANATAMLATCALAPPPAADEVHSHPPPSHPDPLSS